MTVSLADLFPPSESWSKRVSFESRYGTWTHFLDLSPSAEITLPSANYQYVHINTYSHYAHITLHLML